MDWALSPSTYQWNMIEEIVNPTGHGVGKMFSTVLMRGLMSNTDFRDRFITQYVHLLNTTFNSDRMVAILDDLIAEIRPEMEAHIARWGLPSSLSAWESSVSTLRSILSRKTALTTQQLIDTCTSQSGYLPRYFGLTTEQMNAYFQ